MTVTFVAYTNTGGATQVEPTGAAKDDVIFATINATTTVTGPAGWTRIGSEVTNSSGEVCSAWWIVRGASAPSYTWSGTIDGGAVAAYRGANPVFDGSGQSAVNSAVAPSISPTASDARLVCLYADSGSTGVTAPAGMTLDTNSNFNVAASLQLSSAGATGTKTFGGTSQPAAAWSIGLAPAGMSPAINRATPRRRFLPERRRRTPQTPFWVQQSGFSGSLTFPFTMGGSTLLDITMGGSLTMPFTMTGGFTVISRVFTGRLDIELTPGVWTDFTSRLALRVRSLQIRQGKPTLYDDVGPGRMYLALFNDDGALMPDNTASALYPNFVEGKRIRWQVTKSGVTYTRYIGWIQDIQPEFPTDSTVGSVVQITAVDALGLLSQRKLRSIMCEAALWRARTDGFQVDVVEFVPIATGLSAAGTNYSQDTTPGVTGALYNGTWPILGFGSAPSDITSEGVLSANVDSNFDCNMTRLITQPNCKYITYLWKTPRDLIPTATAYFVASFQDNAANDLYHIAVAKNGTANALFLMNSTGVTNLGIIGNVPFGAWVKVDIYPDGGNPASATTTATVVQFGGALLGITGAAVDMRPTRRILLPASIGPKYSGDYGTLQARCGTGTAAVQAWFYGWAAAADAVWTVAYRAARVADWTNQLPISWTDAGTPSTAQAATGTTTGRTGLEEIQTTMTSARGLAWARPWDGTIVRAWSGALRPGSPVATISTDADCAGSPRLSRGVQDRPTRIEMRFPGGSVLARDATAEAGGVQRLRSSTCYLADSSAAQTLAGQVLADGAGGTRITQVTVDLTTGETDHTAALFSEAGLGGLFPLQRVRLAVPSSHFGAATVDALVQGWTETYTPAGVSVQLDTTPA